MNNTIPKDQLCDSGCKLPAKYFSKYTGRYRCLKSSNSCPANKAKNADGLRKAHIDGKMKGWTDEDRSKSHVSLRKNLIESKPFEELGRWMRKNIILEEQDNKCVICELTDWLDATIVLEMDHIDGNTFNNKRENLRCICPNCHSQTENFRAKNQAATNKTKQKCLMMN